MDKPGTSGGLAGGCLHDLDRDLRGNVRSQRNAHLVQADVADRLSEVDPMPVDLHPRRRLDRLGDLRRGDRAEQPTVGTGLCRDAERLRLESRLDRLSLRALLDLARRAALTPRLGVLYVASRRCDGKPARDQVVARIAAGNRDDVADVAELSDGLAKDDLRPHVRSGALRPPNPPRLR